MDTQVSLAIVGLISTVITALISGVIAYLVAKLNITQSRASTKVDIVADILEKNTEINDQKMDGLQKIAVDTHTLVNNAMGIQLKKNLELAEWKLQHSPPEEKEAAQIEVEAARETLRIHKEKQEVVDKQTIGRIFKHPPSS